MSDTILPGVLAPVVVEASEGAAPLVLQTPTALRNQKRAARLQRIREIDDDIRFKAAKIASAALDASQIDDLTPAPKGWSESHARVARDARTSMKQAPSYLAMARSILESYKRQESNEKPSPVMNTTTVYVDKAVFQYPTKDVTGE